VKIGKHEEEDILIRTIFINVKNEAPTENKQTLVLLHGYGGSGCLFYPILKKLGESFEVVLVDIVGMAGSSRPNNFKVSEMTPQTSIDYFVDFLEEWRKKVKFYYHKWKFGKESYVSNLEANLKVPEFTKFILAGHSFGGYVVGFYSLKYP
jgi:pimeloyl-ACP methyl ester carboxylesterase